MLNNQILNVSADTYGYSWTNVNIGGGGYTTDILIHPKEPGLMYARSDVAGVFKWNSKENKWESLMGSFGYSNNRVFGVDGIAIDPNDTDVIYAAVEKNWNQTGDVIKSTDRGKTWTFTKLNKKFHGNGPWRYTGELIAVDPVNSNIVYVGTRTDGLYKSTNKAAGWRVVSGVPKGEIVPQSEMPLLQKADNPIGIRSVVFDPTSASNGVTQTIYVSVIGKGIYQTNNAGVSWYLMNGSPTLAARMEVAKDGVLYVTTLGQGVKKYVGGVWYDITPSNSNLLYCGLSTDPDNSDNVIVSAWANTGDCTELPIYRTNNKGDSWDTISTTTQRNRQFAPKWFPEWFFLASTSQVVFDPHNSGQVFAADWYSVWKTPNIWKNETDSLQWSAVAKGLENTCVFDLVSMPTGANLFSSGADFGGLRHSDIAIFPETGNVNTVGNINSIDFCEANPNYIAFTGSKFHDSAGVFAVSSDNGETFTEIKAPNNERNGRVAYSATDINKIVWVPQSGAPIVTTDRGQTWQKTSGAPNDTVTDFWLTKDPLESDRVNGNTFYLLRATDGETNEFYRSTDGGFTWSMVNNTQLSTAVPWFYPQVKAAPGMEGEVWIAQSTNGLFRSSDGGNTFTKAENVQVARLVAFGRNPPGKNNPAVFVQGTVNNIADGVFRSDDMGKTWVKINYDYSRIGNVPTAMVGDRQVFGRVYIGTNGSGVFCGEPIDNMIFYDDFLENDILSYENKGISIVNESLCMPKDSFVTGIKTTKNFSVEFDVNLSKDEAYTLNLDLRKNLNAYLQISHNEDGFVVSKLANGTETILGKINSNYIASSKNVHIKYVVFEDRVGIYFNDELIKSFTDSLIMQEGNLYELSLSNTGESDLFIDNLKIQKVILDDCTELYKKVFHENNFSSQEKPWYANSNCQVVDGALKMISGSKFSAYTIPKNSVIYYDMDYKFNGDITNADLNNVFTTEWNLRKTYDGNYYHLFNLRYNYYKKIINIQVSKINNGQTIWVGETTVPSESRFNVGLCCLDDNMSVMIDGNTVYSWIDDNNYPLDSKYTITERTWSTVLADVYALMDNYKIVQEKDIDKLESFIDEITFNKKDGGVLLSSERLCDENYILKVNLNNISNNEKTADIVTAVYQNEKIIDINVYPIVIKANVDNQTIKIPIKLNCSKFSDNREITLKSFMLDDIKNVKPLVDSSIAENLSIEDITESAETGVYLDDIKCNVRNNRLKKGLTNYDG